jgi:hypothetical protein
MGISLVGHSPSFEIWVFNVNGKQFVGRNYSTQDPLQLSFRGVWDKYSGTAPLINTSGFNITESTDKVAVWTWRGKQYTSWWMVISADDEDPDAEVTLKFGPAVPYAGPPVSPVGTGGVTVPAPVPADVQTNAEAVSDTNEALVNANKALAVSEAQGKVNIQALNTARVELQNAKDALAAAQAKSTADQAALMARLQEQLQAIEERTQIQLNVYKQALAQAQQAPPPTPATRSTPPPTAPIPSPVVTPPTTPATAPSSSPAETDWVKLGLQLGAAYLLLS